MKTLTMAVDPAITRSKPRVMVASVALAELPVPLAWSRHLGGRTDTYVNSGGPSLSERGRHPVARLVGEPARQRAGRDRCRAGRDNPRRSGRGCWGRVVMSWIRAAYWDPDGVRYGIPTFWWRGTPDSYATRRQLRAASLCPAGQPIAAQILWRGVGGTRVAYLYRVDLAASKRSATPAVYAALACAMRARRTCPTCRVERPYCIPRSLGECVSCAHPEQTGDLT